MRSTLSGFCVTVFVLATALLTSFDQNPVSSPVSNSRDSIDSVLETRVQANIDRYQQVIYDYHGIAFSRDSLLLKLEQTVERASSDSHDIKGSIISFRGKGMTVDTANLENDLRPLFDSLKKSYASLLVSEDIIAKTTNELAQVKRKIKEIEPGYLAANQNLSKIIPDDYVGKLHLVYKGNAYTVFISNSKLHNVTISKSNTPGRTLKDGWNQQTKAGVKPIAIFNGGMFHPDYSATGLLVENAQKISPVNSQEKATTGNFFMLPNGIFFIDTLYQFHVVETREFIQKFGAANYPGIQFATQSGPMLLINNKIHKSFSNGSRNLNIRNAVGVNGKIPNRVIFAISDDPVNFYDFAVFYKEFLKCSNALYLDGTVSRMYIDHKGIKTGKLDADQRLGPLITINQKNRKE